jgi:hypothetical protein
MLLFCLAQQPNVGHERLIVCRTSLDKWSARRRDLYLTTHNTHSSRQTSMPPARYFFFFVLCTSSALLLLPWLSWVCLLSLLCKSHNTNIHAPGGIRTRNTSKRSAADPRLRPLGRWDPLLFMLLSYNISAIPRGNYFLINVIRIPEQNGHRQ